ncbi:MAG: GDSL-type esterase/lipase family protein, partial [Planctomycetota bacterium]
MSARSPWVFLGDSNTYSGGYIAILDAWLKDSGHPKLLNLGVSSETASGLSEVDHPFKRPCVHERLDELLARVEPGVVFIFYGMNDGIYQPPRAENMQAYREGMMRLAAAVHQSGAELVCITPPVFEPEPVKKRDRIGPSEKGRYAWFAPAADYDRVLEEQTQWCLTNQIRASAVIDIRSMLQQSKKTLRETDLNFNFSKDGVHFGAVAHGLIAEKILAALGAPAELRANYPKEAAIDAATEKNKILR